MNASVNSDRLTRIFKSPVVRIISAAVGLVALYSSVTFFMEGATAVKIGESEVRYDSSVEESEAQALGNFLKQEGYFSDRPATVRVSRDDGVIKVQLVRTDEAVRDTSTDHVFSFFAAAISQRVFGGARTVICIANTELKNDREIEAMDIGTHVSLKKSDVYIKDGVTEAQAASVVATLTEGSADDLDMIIQVSKPGGQPLVRIVADRTIVDSSPNLSRIFTATAMTLSQTVFDGSPVSIELCDAGFKGFLSVSSSGDSSAPKMPQVPAL